MRPTVSVSATLVAWIWTAYKPMEAHDAVGRLMHSAALADRMPERYSVRTTVGPIYDPVGWHQRDTLARSWPELKQLLFLRYGPIPIVHGGKVH